MDSWSDSVEGTPATGENETTSSLASPDSPSAVREKPSQTTQLAGPVQLQKVLAGVPLSPYRLIVQVCLQVVLVREAQLIGTVLFHWPAQRR